MFASSTSLLRFVTDGLTATIDSYLAGALSLDRFAWELSARVESLASLDAPTRALTRLRWLHRTVELVNAARSTRTADAAARDASVARATDAVRAADATGLTDDERDTLSVALADFRAVLATLVPHNPLDPAGVARPATVLAVVA